MTLPKSTGSLTVIGVIALYTAVHVAYMVAVGSDLQDSVFLWAGPVSLICMSFAILISVRPRLVEDHFGGLDRMYQVHKWLGISAMILFALHFALSFGGGGDGGPGMGTDIRDGGGSGGGEWIEVSGMYPMIGFFLLIVLTLNRKFAYHHWIKTHLLMGLLFIGVSVHAVLVLLEGREIAMASLPGGMILAAAIVGVLAYLYKQTFYRTARAHAYTLAEVNRMDRATEVVLSPVAKRFAFQPGQFAFLRIRRPGFDEAHPFTISSGTRDQNLRFTLKMLGDFTRQVHDHLEPGVNVEVEGPYGRFNPIRDAAPQVWIAGGIGITPFLSALRSLEQRHDKTIDLFYCVREDSEALYLDELERLAGRNDDIKLHLFRSDIEGRLSDEIIAERVPSISHRNIYFCGPQPMLRSLIAGLKTHGVRKAQWHYEEFAMR